MNLYKAHFCNNMSIHAHWGVFQCFIFCFLLMYLGEKYKEDKNKHSRPKLTVLLRFVFTVSRGLKSIFTTTFSDYSRWQSPRCRACSGGVFFFFFLSFILSDLKLNRGTTEKIQRQIPSLLCVKVSRERAGERRRTSLSAKFNRLVWKHSD